MINGFLEYGLAALIGFGFVNLVWAMVFLSDVPPVVLKKVEPRMDRKEPKEWIPMEEAEMVTPIIKQRTLAA
jgi:hypothetical protein